VVDYQCIIIVITSNLLLMLLFVVSWSHSTRCQWSDSRWPATEDWKWCQRYSWCH